MVRSYGLHNVCTADCRCDNRELQARYFSDEQLTESSF